jgi:hypothetical protein
LGTETPLSAQIGEKPTQFADIEPARMAREKMLNCKDSALVREVPVHD